MSMEKKISHPNHSDDCAKDVARSFRNLPPAHYIIRIDSFSNLKNRLSGTGAKSYESKTFEACGYKWILSLYPNGDKERNGEGYISMYLVIQDTEALPLGWEVYVNFKFFVFDQVRGKYLTIQDALGKVRRFDKLKIEWGFPHLLPHNVFHDSNNGYLIHDKCVFGAEVLVINRTGKGESFTSSVLDDVDGRYTWKISPFSALGDQVHSSDVFSLGNFKWQLRLYPKGTSSAAGSSISLFLVIVELKTSDYVDVEYKLSIKNQCGKEDKESQVIYRRFTSSRATSGFNKFLSLIDLKDTSEGFLVNDCLIIEAQIPKIFTVQSFA